MKRSIRLALLAAVLFATGCDTVSKHPSLDAGDWPQYRADAGRTGYTPAVIPSSLTLSWKREQQAPTPAWKGVHTRMTFDYAYQPVVSGKTLFYGSSADCRVYAVDTSSGRVRWTFTTGAPVRFAPAVWRDRLFVVSDDGRLYCLSASSGKELWRKRCAPGGGMVIGNDRMIARWPVRGGVVVRDDVLYVGSGIWPTEGIYIRALDPESGEEKWVNDDSGGIEMPQPHGGAVAKSGISSQGYLLSAGDRLFVPTGRSVPAALDIETGALEYFHLQRQRAYGGSRAMATGRYLFVTGGNTRDEREVIGGTHALLDAESGELAVREEIDSRAMAATPGHVLYIDRRDGELKAVEREKLVVERETADSPRDVRRPAYLNNPSWTIPTGETDAVSLIAAGGRIVAGFENGRIVVMDAPGKEVVWKGEVDGVPYGLAAAHGKLFVSTDTGTLYCFDGSGAVRPRLIEEVPVNRPYGSNDMYSKAADEIIEATGVRGGWCLDMGCGDGALAFELARKTDLNIVAVDPDPKNVARARKRLADAKLYGTRVTVFLGTPAEWRFPDYFATLIVSGRSVDGDDSVIDDAEIARLQRPCGGIVCTGKPGAMKTDTRGKLAGADDWPHLYHDAANTITSGDELVDGDLAILWYKDDRFDVPSRHGRGVGPLFKDGRLFVQGLDGIRAYDAYNGTILWEYDIPGIQTLNDFDHALGASLTHQNWCIDGDRLYVRIEHARGTSAGRTVVALDTATGLPVRQYEVPKLPNAPFLEYWGYLAVVDGTIYGGVANYGHTVNWGWGTYDTHKLFGESIALFAMDAETGAVRWIHRAKHSIRHNAIAIGSGRVHLIDRPAAVFDRAMFRDGRDKPADHPTGALVALDAESGDVVYRKTADIYGTLLALSTAHDVLVMTYQFIRFGLISDFGGRMTAFRASDGARLWDVDTGVRRGQDYAYSSRPIVNDRTVILEPFAWDILIGEKLDFRFEHSYTCGIVASSKNMLVFRSATLGYYKLDEQEMGTLNYGGIRPGCWLNAIPAGGLVLMPDATDRCNCSYLNKATVALMPVRR